MHRIDFPAGSTIRLTATARPDIGVHRWDVRIFTADGQRASSAPRLTYGSQIGGLDCEQRIDIPAQEADCRLEAWSRHAVAGGWQDNRCSIDGDTPSQLLIGFSDASRPKSRKDDVLLSFAFESPDRHCDSKDITMAKGQKKSNRETRKPKQAKPKVEAATRSFLGTAECAVGKSPGGVKRSGG